MSLWADMVGESVVSFSGTIWFPLSKCDMFHGLFSIIWSESLPPISMIGGCSLDGPFASSTRVLVPEPKATPVVRSVALRPCFRVRCLSPIVGALNRLGLRLLAACPASLPMDRKIFIVFHFTSAISMIGGDPGWVGGWDWGWGLVSAR